MDELPPKLPTESEALDRVIVLLGCVSKGHALRPSVRHELMELVEALPDVATATPWKSEIKKLRAEFVDELRREHDCDRAGGA